MPTVSLVESGAVIAGPDLDGLLGAFLGEVPDATGVVVAGEGGTPIASRLAAERTQLVAVSAMAKLASWAGEAVAANLRLSGMSGITIEGPTWKVIVAPTPSHAAAVLITIEESTDPSQVHRALPALLRAVDRNLEAATPR
jgi:predicted regulator of Ras-like GTPase activity (Roadblock/LC7/MglB family)